MAAPAGVRTRPPPSPWLSPAVFTGALSPLVVLALRGARGELGANPVAEVLNQLGLLALIFLVASLACTPAAQLLGARWALRIRRQLGLWAFAYGALHGLTYLVADRGGDLGALLEDVLERPFILFGALALLAMLPLALTSTDASVRRLGFRRWKLLHRLAYVAGAFGALHFVIRTKTLEATPLAYAGVIAALLALRAVAAARKR